MSYILTGAGANLISWLVLPTSSVSLGASGAVFGLFTISVLVKVISLIMFISNSFTQLKFIQCISLNIASFVMVDVMGLEKDS